MSDRLDLDQLVRKGTVELGPEEHPDERAARLRREERRDRVELWKGAALFVVLLGGVATTALGCAYVAFLSPGSDEPTRQRAFTLLASLLSGGVAFLVGRALPKG